MSSLPNPRQPRPPTEWVARLIPGVAAPVSVGVRKPPRSVQGNFALPSESVPITPEAPTRSAVSQSAITLLLPSPLRSRSAANWLRSLAADFAMVGLNWLLIGALALPLQSAFPQAHLLGNRPGASFPPQLMGIALLFAALITLLGYSEGLYTAGSDFSGQARSLGKAVVWSTALLCVAYCLQDTQLGLTPVLCVAAVLHFGSLLAWRSGSFRRGSRKPPPEVRNVLIVGAGDVGLRVASHVEHHPEAGRAVYGFLDNDRPLGNGVIGRVSDLARLARTGFVDEVILAAPHDRELTLRVLGEAQGLHLDVEMVPDLFGCGVTGEVERVGDMPVICLHEERLPASALLLKRLVDVVGSSFGLLVVSPLLAIIAAFIKLDSKGPVVYAAPRVGRKGRPFRCYKFRTMVSNADQLKDNLRGHNQRSGPFFKVANDPRITRAGRFLRRYSLDELPQLWNVLQGDMSLVGPRPHPLDDVAAYEIEHLARLDVTPGITGLWQVTARRDPSFQKGIELDREYIHGWTLGLDMRILFRTFWAVVGGSGD